MHRIRGGVDEIPKNCVPRLKDPAKETEPKASPLKAKKLAVLHLIHSGLSPFRLSLARKKSFSPALLTLIVKSPIEKGLVVERPTASSSFGRRQTPLEIRSDVAYLVGVEIGSYRAIADNTVTVTTIASRQGYGAKLFRPSRRRLKTFSVADSTLQPAISARVLDKLDVVHIVLLLEPY